MDKPSTENLDWRERTRIRRASAQYKLCPQCGEMKDVINFAPNDGTCKSCRAIDGLKANIVALALGRKRREAEYKRDCRDLLIDDDSYWGDT